MKTVKILGSLLLCMIATVGMAQDKLYIKGEKKPLDVKIIEVGPNEVKVQDKENDVIQVYETFDVYKIVYGNGRVQKFESEIEQNLDKYRDMNINAFSIDAISPLQNFIRISYDRVLKPGMSYELSASWIGIDNGRVLQYYGYYDPNTYRYSDSLMQNTRGFRLEGGVKFVRLPNFVSQRIRYRHLLQGSYLKPWAAIERVSQNYLDTVLYDQNTSNLAIASSNRSYFAFNIGMDFGKSWVARNRVLLDFYFGVGYSFSNFKKINEPPYNPDGGYGYGYFQDTYDDSRGYGYARAQPNKTGSFIARIGLKMGYVFNWKKDAAKNIYAD